MIRKINACKCIIFSYDKEFKTAADTKCFMSCIRKLFVPILSDVLFYYVPHAICQNYFVGIIYRTTDCNTEQHDTKPKIN